MVKIENFSGVLEIAFGMNAVFYIFEFIPYAEDRLTKLIQENNQLAKEKIELTQNHEVFPVGFVVGAWHCSDKMVLRFLTVLMSSVLLGVLLFSSFHPDAGMPTFLMCLLIIFAFGIPLIGFGLYSRNVKFIQGANRLLAKEISEARRAKLRAEK